MRSKKMLLIAAGILTAAVLAVMTGCGDKPVASTADTYGLKAVSINSTALFKGDISKLPGCPPIYVDAGVLPKATSSALIDFDKAYAMVSQSMTHNVEYTMCEYWTDRYDAFKDADTSDLNKWETVVAGCRRSAFYEIVSVSELEKNGDYVEGTVYVKPGVNIVGVYFVNSNGEISWVRYNWYANLDGLDNSDNDEYQSLLEYYEEGWENPWTETGASEFLPTPYIAGSYVDGAYCYQVPNLGSWQNEIGIPASFVEEECAPPSVTLLYPADGAIDVEPMSLSVEWESTLDFPTYTLYFGTTNPPPLHSSNLYNTWEYPTGLVSGQTYYWQVSGDDGMNQAASSVFSFTTR